jgi:hypothetical protein
MSTYAVKGDTVQGYVGRTPLLLSGIIAGGAGKPYHYQELI